MSAAEISTSSQQRLVTLKELWARSQKDQLEIGRLLYEEREERLGVGGRGDRDGFHQWLREAGIPKTSAYRRIAEYEVSIGVREEPEDKPVPNGTTIADVVQAEHATSSGEMPYQTEPSAPNIGSPTNKQKPHRNHRGQIDRQNVLEAMKWIVTHGANDERQENVIDIREISKAEATLMDFIGGAQ